MSLPAAVQEKCEAILGTKVRRAAVLGGGDINEARRLDTPAGPVFLKMNTAPQAEAMFTTEAHGLTLLARNDALRTPRVLGLGKTERHAFLLLEFVENGGPGSRFWEEFGRGFARLHRIRDEQYGLDRDNFIGTLPQSNQPHDRWIDFYREERLRPQLGMAREDGRLTETDSRQFDRLFDRLPELLTEERPSLIHGDLWAGNYMTDADGRPVLIDPAVSFSHREADLAMTRLFGGFSPAFYRAYDEAFPLETGWEGRLELYQLYYLLVHVNLFGGGYVRSVRGIVNRYV